MAKFEGKDGRWITTKSGRHVFIENGKTVKEALGDAFEEFSYDPDEDFDKEDPVPLKMKSPKVQRSSSILGYTHDIRNEFKEAMKMNWYDDNINMMTNKTLANNIKLPNGVKLKDTSTPSRYKSGFGIILDIPAGSTKVSIAQKFYHETGHASDHIKGREFYSSTYLSPTYGKTLSEMIEEEFKNIDDKKLFEIYKEWDDEIDDYYNKYLNDSITWEEYKYHNNCISKAQTDLVDIIQAQKGEDFVKNNFGWIPHPQRNGIPYFQIDPYMKGTELFAEITCHRATDKNKHLVKFLEKYCPKTLDIYNELLEELK